MTRAGVIGAALAAVLAMSGNAQAENAADCGALLDAMQNQSETALLFGNAYADWTKAVVVGTTAENMDFRDSMDRALRHFDKAKVVQGIAAFKRLCPETAESRLPK